MQLKLAVLPQTLAVARLSPDERMPAWVRGPFASVTWTADELSIVCDDEAIPPDVRAERGWRAMRVAGSIAFEVTGVAAALVSPLAVANISVFMLATFDTDYLLVKAAALDASVAILREAGHEVVA